MTTGRSDLWKRPGYSLGEMLAALVIAAMILTVILSVYGQVQRAADAVIEMAPQ